jgi:hypothetical protein
MLVESVEDMGQDQKPPCSRQIDQWVSEFHGAEKRIGCDTHNHLRQAGGTCQGLPEIGQLKILARRRQDCGENPASIQILPEERQASDCIAQAVRNFYAICQHDPDVQAHLPSFIDAIHRCQGSLGSLRFWHTLNQDYRRELQGGDSEIYTTVERLEALTHWQTSFHLRVEALPAPAARQIMGKLLMAFEFMMLLTRQYPDQHIYDDFMEGMERCLEILALLPSTSEFPTIQN